MSRGSGPSANRSGHAANGQAWEPDLLGKWDSTALRTGNFNTKDRPRAGLILDEQYHLIKSIRSILGDHCVVLILLQTYPDNPLIARSRWTTRPEQPYGSLHQQDLTGIVHPVIPYERANVLVGDWSVHAFLRKEVLTYLVIAYRSFAVIRLPVSAKLQNTS